ncbi:MAG: MFS transporter [Trueperaceae bacterium]|nr:MFS transporter [Trueperaceae bacterium]MCC6310916.1 MFS transporter [Trueperaceae bacterium]MCO5174601.1 MFS transporter [Trueperaceae bacterium]MCW5819643.1 MFS transporter [Trueperaceae bacterium]
MKRGRTGLGSWQLLGLGVGAASLAITWGLYNNFMPLLLRDYVRSSGMRGAIMGLDNVMAMILLPLLGTWSDRIDGPLGKRLPFLIVSMPLAAVLFALLPFAKAAFWTLLAVDVAFLLTMTAFRAPLAALMPDHVPPSGRPHANAVLTMLGAVGGAIGLLFVAPMADVAPWFPFAVAGAVILAALFAVRAATEPHPPYVSAGVIQEDAPLLGGLVRDAATVLRAREGGILLVLVAVFFAFFGYSALEAQFSTFATEEFGLSGGSSGMIMGVTIAGFVVMALPAARLAHRLGELNTMRLGASLLALWLLVATLTADPATLSIWLGLGGASWAFVLVPAYPLVVNQGGEDRVGFYTGIYYLFGSAAAILAPSSVGAAMDLLGNSVLLPAVGVSMVITAVTLTLAMRSRSARA